MPITTYMDSTLENFSIHIEELMNISNRLLDVTNAQIDAVIYSDMDKIEELTDDHFHLSSEFKKQEERFIHELGIVLNKKGDERIQLSQLKELFPEAAGQIDVWRTGLIRVTTELHQKHQQIVQLLELAMVRNASLMKTIYSLHNAKATHYSTAGSKENVVSGVAINQKA